MYKKLGSVLIIYIIAYIYCLEFAPRISHCRDGMLGVVNTVHESCVFGCDRCTAVTGGRGDQYYIGATDVEKNERLKRCVVTLWGLAHFLLYAVIGWVAPDMFWETFAVGAAFEAYEYVQYSCEDPLDLVWNSAGFIAGASLHNLQN